MAIKPTTRRIATFRILKLMPLALIAASAVVGCGPAKGPPKVVLEPPAEYPANWGSRRLYHTPNAYIYAQSDDAAGEADGWVVEVKEYIRKKHGRTLEKGVVVVMEPGDEPVAQTLEELEAIETDRTIMPMQPRVKKSAAEMRTRMETEGIPEGPAVRAAAVPLSSSKLAEMGWTGPSPAWAEAAPSHALASQSGVEAIASGLRKRNPKLTEEQARSAAGRFPDMAAKPFEVGRGQTIFVLWVQQQTDWTEEQRREAIRENVKHVLKSQGVPAPKDEELGW